MTDRIDREAGSADTSYRYRKAGGRRRGRSRDGMGICVLPSVEALAQADTGAGALELVDPNVFRACGDPRNLPFSNEKGEGFENKLAELFATKLGKKLSYTYFPQATGFVSKTLGSYRCDVIIGFPQGDDQAQVTVPYYRTTYALIVKAGKRS